MENSAGVYQLADLRLASDVLLPELQPAAEASGLPWCFSLDPEPYPGPRARWFHEWREHDGKRWLRFGRRRGSYVLRFARWVTFVVDPDRHTIACHSEPDTPLETIRHLLLNQVLPLLAAGPNRVVLHAAAVRHQGRAIGFVGPGGSGKSTLCAALVQAGCGLMTDDALVIDRRGDEFLVTPTYAAIRLWPDTAQRLSTDGVRAARVAHYTSKLRICDPGFDRTVARLDRLCILGPPAPALDTMSIRRLSPREALMALVGSLFQLDIEDHTQVAATFEATADLAQHIAVLAVSYPWNLDRLAASSEAVLASVLAR